MSRILKVSLGIVLLAGAVGVLSVIVSGHTVAVLSPKGTIALQQRDLLVGAFLLMMLIVVPVFVLTFGIAWRYRAGNTAAKYTPDWDHNRRLEALWWGFPTVIIVVLSIVTWQSSHALDPARTLVAEGVKPIKVQVVALQWKWLFIYPEQHVASVNYLPIPAGTPVEFEITSDAPMNSFWIPQLGGQIYAMSGMSTRLNLMAGHAGSYAGSSANLSGKGFAGMKFVTQAGSRDEFNAWVSQARAGRPLTQAAYDELAKPSENNAPATYSTPALGLYDGIIMKYMMPSGQVDTTEMSAH